jgi:hypothetical protein
VFFEHCPQSAAKKKRLKSCIYVDFLQHLAESIAHLHPGHHENDIISQCFKSQRNPTFSVRLLAAMPDNPET